MPVSPTQVVLAVALLVTLAVAWYSVGRGRWRAVAEDRLLYGVPWGTLVTVGVVVAFYLFVQSGLWHWADPVIFAFVSWSYYYPFGVLTAGIAHGGPDHLVSNLAGTLVLAPIAEYAWGHYAPARGTAADAEGTGDAGTAPDGEPTPGVEDSGEAVASADRSTKSDRGAGDDAVPSGDDHRASGDGGDRFEAFRDALRSPRVRAFVLFPAALLGAALLTSVFSMGPGLGFSGAVYAIIGFAVVTYPVTTVVAVVASSALGVLYDALTRPVVTATVDTGAPGPPSWGGVGFQAHALGFLLGVLAGVALLAYRHRRPDASRVFFATLLVGLVQSLWLVSWSSGDTYTMYRGVGVVVFLVVVGLVTLAAASDRSDRDGPSGRVLGILWLAVAGLLLLGIVSLMLLVGSSPSAYVPVAALAALLLAPGVLAVLPDWSAVDAGTRRKTGVAALVVLVVLVALPSVLLSSLVVGADPVPNDDGITVGDYSVTYAEDAPVDRELFGVSPANDSAATVAGVVVVSEARDVWTVGVQEYALRHEGNGTVAVGGAGWHESIRAERTAWEVVGNDTAYAVDLHHDGESVRSFATDPVTASARVAGATVSVAPTDSGFDLRVTREGSLVDAIPVPAAGESTTVGDLELETEADGETRRIYATGTDSRALVAVEETY